MGICSTTAGDIGTVENGAVLIMTRFLGGRRMPLKRVSCLVLLIALGVSVGVGWVAHRVAEGQEQRLLTERANEVSVVLSSTIAMVQTGLEAQGSILQATDGAAAYGQAAANAVSAGPGQRSFAWLRPEGPGDHYLVLAARGDSLHTGELVEGARVRTFDRARRSTQMVATPIFGSQRTLGFAIGSPAAPAGTVLYSESQLGPVKPPRAAGALPFSELDVALYDSTVVRPGQVLISTTSALPLRGNTHNKVFHAGASSWVLSVKARTPLVGSLTAHADWLALAAGVLVSILVAAVVESAARRRDAALALYAGEHQIAETLQRSLLPQLPTLPGLDLAAR
jgi:hypothetical protein